LVRLSSLEDHTAAPKVPASVLNPKGCWDWWGYTGNDYLTKNAPQIAAIWRMVERLAMSPAQS